MLVRAKRLVFNEVTPVLSDRKWRSSTPFGDYEILESSGCFSCYYRNGFVTHKATLESAQTACQSDFDRRWRESTEVPDLVWTEGYPESKCGLYEIWNESDGYVPDFHATRDDGSWSENHESRELAKSACNAHNRAAVLGE